MGFPYFSPLSPWIVDIMTDREKNPVLSSVKNPFVILTSGALVVNGTASDDFVARKTELANIINDLKGSPKSYKGCIISNNINNTDLTYTKNETIVGVDFTGEYIKVQGESGRYISTPIIETLDIDTDGANNTLKTARVSVRVFSLKQLELFEMFFMKPGMNVLVEFGDGSMFKVNKNIRTKKYDAYNSSGEKIDFSPFSDVSHALIPKKDYKEFYESFSDYYRASVKAFANYTTRLQQSLGTYDFVAGKVTDYNFSIESDGTYMVSIEITQGNQISMAIPVKPKKDKGQKDLQNSNDAPTEPEQVIDIVSSDLNLDKTKLKDLLSSTPHPDGDNINNWLKKDFFNFFKINTTNKETTASDKRYVSLRFVLKILLNYIVSDNGVDKDFFKLEIPTYKIGNKEVEMIPVNSNKYIISNNQDILFPTNELPTFIAGSDGKIVIDEKAKPIDGRINGYDFHVKGELKEVYNGIVIDEQKADSRTGNALNIFINYEEIVRLWVRSYTRIQFLEEVLKIINKNSFGLIGLVFGLREELTGPSVIDYRFKNDLKLQSTEETYRFKPNTMHSIVKDFSFNFEMSNLVAGRTVFNSGKFLAEASKENAEKVLKSENKILELPEEAFKSIDNSTLGNADGWYSINRVELERILKDIKATNEQPKTISAEKTDDDGVTNSAESLLQVIESKSIKYAMDTSGKVIRTLVFEDRQLIQEKIKTEPQNTKKPTLSPIDVTLTIDGFSGFRSGQYFKVDGVPEIYNQIGVFQITNTKHNVDNSGWFTTIEASYNLIPKK